MRTGIVTTFAFVAGAAVGAVVAWKVTATRYEKIANKEAESFRNKLASIRANNVTDIQSEDETIEEQDEEDPAQDGYSEIIDNEEYITYEENEPIAYKKKDKPYLIHPDEFGDIDDYELKYLTYYADKVLADDLDNKIKDVEHTVGWENLRKFGTYEEDGDDEIHVRNDILECQWHCPQKGREKRKL